MSNKIVPAIYRTVIDDVVNHVRAEFDEYGVSEDVLGDLMRRWEEKVIASNVAEFEIQQQASALSPPLQQPPHMQSQSQPPSALHQKQPAPLPSAFPPLSQLHPIYQNTLPYNNQISQVKPEPLDSRYGLVNLLGPTSLGIPPPVVNGLHAFPGPPPPPTARARIPQLDGPADDNEEDTEDNSQPSKYAPRSSHPSLPQPSQAGSSQQEPSEAINSDLDDSDEEDIENDEDGGAAEADIVFCTYDKVARVKAKWKCVLKDGMAHINGKDYLFTKCTGEFEW